jgi:AAA ATPase domain
VEPNPYQPAPGAPPPVLAGRDAELRAIADALARTGEGRPAQPLVFVGLRGIGKTALLHRLAADGGTRAVVVAVEAAKDTTLAGSLRVALQTAIRRSGGASRKLGDALQSALEKLPLPAYELPNNLGAIALTPPPAAQLEGPLSDAMSQLAVSLHKHGRYLAVTIDELQDADLATLRPLITVIHQSAASQAPMLFACAGLPGTPARLHEARTYTERWQFFRLTLLTPAQATDAIWLPAAALGVSVERDALDLLAGESGGYPFFVQEYAKAAWDHHRGKRITLADAQAVIGGVRALLENSFYRERFERLTGRELRFAIALADLGPGAQQLRAIAERMGTDSAALGSTRTQLIKKDVIVVPGPGLVEFRIPLSDRYIENNRDALEQRAAPRVRKENA